MQKVLKGIKNGDDHIMEYHLSKNAWYCKVVTIEWNHPCVHDGHKSDKVPSK